MNNENEVVTVEEAATIMKTNPRHITRMINAGELKAKDISLGTGQRKMWRILKSELLKLNVEK